MKNYKRRFSEQLSQDDIYKIVIENTNIHTLAEKKGLTPDEFEKNIYTTLKSFFGESL